MSPVERVKAVSRSTPVTLGLLLIAAVGAWEARGEWASVDKRLSRIEDCHEVLSKHADILSDHERRLAQIEGREFHPEVPPQVQK